MLLEVACFSLEDALLAQSAGAHRIELCVDYDAGGLTPSSEIIKRAPAEISIPLFLMIRPRAGNFVYSEDEISAMKAAILEAKNSGYDGVVFGALTANNEVDKKSCSELVGLSHPLACTFHRAFDETPDLLKSLEDVIACGFKRILTSGGKGNAQDNISMLKKLRAQASGRIIIMPGGGVRYSNIHEILTSTSCSEIHSAAWDKVSKRINADELKSMIRA